MPGLLGNRFLSNAVIKTIFETLASRLERSRPLIYLNRTPSVNAFDDEIVGRFTGRIWAADIIANDQEAVVRDAGKIELVSTSIPNLKHGSRLSQEMLNRIDRFRQGMTTVAEGNAMEEWRRQTVENLLFGIRQRQNALILSMMIDATSYDRMGIKISGATWGMPANLKVTVATPWSTAATATPIADIFSMDQIAQDAYGFSFDRVTMGSVNFREMVSTAEFRAAVSIEFGFNLSAGNLATKNDPQMKAMAGKLLNKTIEIDDATINEQNNDGTPASSRVLPLDKVLLSRTQDDNNSAVMDWANGVVTESLVGSMGAEGPFAGPTYGPTGYWTARDDLNPPDICAWGVARGFPRRHEPAATAVLTV